MIAAQLSNVDAAIRPNPINPCDSPTGTFIEGLQAKGAKPYYEKN